MLRRLKANDSESQELPSLVTIGPSHLLRVIAMQNVVVDIFEALSELIILTASRCLHGIWPSIYSFMYLFFYSFAHILLLLLLLLLPRW